MTLFYMLDYSTSELLWRREASQPLRTPSLKVGEGRIERKGSGMAERVKDRGEEGQWDGER